MPVSITNRHADLTPAFQDLIVKKARKLKRYFDKVDQIDVVFTAEKHRRFCEITVKAGPLSAVGKAENGDESHAFEKALKACERQIKEKKRRMIDRRQRVPNVDKAAPRTGKSLSREAAAMEM